MEKFNETTLFTGYLKQLLHNFNLPKYKIYTKEHQAYKEQTGKERYDILETIIKDGETYPNNINYVPYIKNGRIQEYINGEWVNVGTGQSVAAKHSHSYAEGFKMLNYTKTLKINNNVYDSYTHEYLGDYLRFQRDYNDVNLMPLYNCFSNKLCPALNLTINTPDQLDSNNNIIQKGHSAVFDTENKNFKIYMLPVKLFQEYTIAIDSAQSVEIFCGLYNKNQNTNTKFDRIYGETYKIFTSLQFSKPVLFTGLTDYCKKLAEENKNLLAEFAQQESNLKLFIKIPQNNTSTISILEGNYLGWSNSLGRSINKDIKQIFAYGTEAPKENTCPSAQDVADADDYLYYLDTTEKILYIPVLAGENSYHWAKFGSIWSIAKSRLDKMSDYKLIIDDTEYEHATEEKYPEAYKNSHPEVTINNKTAYFNTAIKKLFINCVGGFERKVNYTVLNFENLDIDDNIILRTPLQLLSINTQKQHPFADRLIEYLIGNAITPTDEILDDVIRAQKVMKLATKNNTTYNYYPENTGFWDKAMQYLAYDYINNYNPAFDVNHDILGYIDKDVEKFYNYKDAKTKKSVSISAVELNEEDF